MIMERPTEVRLERADGTVLPLAVGYAGSVDGKDVWMITTPVELAAYDRLTVGAADDEAVLRFPGGWA